MKSIMKVLAVLVVLNTSTWIAPQKASAQVSVNFQVFYDQLSPYGSWVNYPNYGYAWIPNAGPGFSPYSTGGHWVFTEYGWTWASDYSWGWAPFHYGRWYFDPMYGWIWVPDTVWGPAWVVWRNSPGYFGWAPLRPGVSINIAVGSGFYVPNDWWVFVPGQYISSPNVYQYYVPRSNNVTIIKNTTIVNNTYVDNSRHVTYIAGPDKDHVQKVTGAPIKPVAIREKSKPGESVSNGQLNIYRPQVERSNSNGQKPAPRKVENLKDIKPVQQRNAEGQPKNVTPSKQQQPAQREVKPADKNVKPQQPQQRNVEPPKEQQPPHMNAPVDEKKKEREPQPKQNPPKEIDKDQQSPDPHSAGSESHERKITQTEVQKNTEVKRPEEVRKETQQEPPKNERNEKTKNR